jgi:transcriptional regulator with XRE-family HTH domain
MRANKETGFAPYLRQQRQRRGVELPKLAVTSRLPMARLIALESGAAVADPGELRRLAKALDIPTETSFAKAGRFG